MADDDQNQVQNVQNNADIDNNDDNDNQNGDNINNANNNQDNNDDNNNNQNNDHPMIVYQPVNQQDDDDNDGNDISSVSTHHSMPSLMSDDDSDDDISDDNDDESGGNDAQVIINQQQQQPSPSPPPLIRQLELFQPPDQWQQQPSPPPQQQLSPPPQLPQPPPHVPPAPAPPNFDLAQLANLLQNGAQDFDLDAIFNRLRRPQPNRPQLPQITPKQREKRNKLKLIIKQLSMVINKINDIQLRNDNDDDDNKDDNDVMYNVYNKRCNILNPSYNDNDNDNDSDDGDDDDKSDFSDPIVINIPNNYPFVSIYREYDCYIYSSNDDNDDDNIPLPVSDWKMNLLSICPVTKLMFIASGRRIFIYKLSLFINDVNNNYDKPIDIIQLNSAINRIKYGQIQNEPVIYALDHSGYINIIYCKNIKKIPKREPNIIENKQDNSTWSIGCGKTHNRIAVGSNTHIIQIHDFSLSYSNRNLNINNTKLIGHTNNVPSVSYHPYNPNKIISASIDKTIHLWDIEDSFQIKKKIIDFNTKINNNQQMNDSHEGWMWCVEWIINPDLYINIDTVNCMKHIQNIVYRYYNQKCFWMQQITQMKKSLRPKRNRLNTFYIDIISQIIDIANDTIKHFGILSTLCSSKTQNILFLKLNEILLTVVDDMEKLNERCLIDKQSKINMVDEYMGINQEDDDDNDDDIDDIDDDDDDDELIEMSSASTHSSMPDILQDDDDDDLIVNVDGEDDVDNHNDDDNGVMNVDDDVIADIQPTVNVVNDISNDNVPFVSDLIEGNDNNDSDNDNDDDNNNNDNINIDDNFEESEEFQAPLAHKIGAKQSTPPPSQQGFDTIIQYNNDNQIDIDTNLMNNDKQNYHYDPQNHYYSFSVITYNDNGNNIDCKIDNLRLDDHKDANDIKQDINDIDIDDLDDLDDDIPFDHIDITNFVEFKANDNNNNNELSILFGKTVKHFEFIESSLIMMQTKINETTKNMISNSPLSPFIDNKFKTNTIILNNECINIAKQFKILYQNLITNKYIINNMNDNDNDIIVNDIADKNKDNTEIISQFRSFCQLYINFKTLYIEWISQSNTIEKRNEALINARNNASVIINRDYFVACSQSNIYLINSENMEIVDKIENIMNNLLPSYKYCDRLEYIEYIEALSLLIISSYASNQFILIRICNKNKTESEPIMIIEGFYPKNNKINNNNENLGCILGMQCVECQNDIWRLYVLYQIIDNSLPRYRGGVPVKIVSFVITNDKTTQNDNNNVFLQCLM